MVDERAVRRADRHLHVVCLHLLSRMYRASFLSPAWLRSRSRERTRSRGWIENRQAKDHSSQVMDLTPSSTATFSAHCLGHLAAALTGFRCRAVDRLGKIGHGPKLICEKRPWLGRSVLCIFTKLYRTVPVGVCDAEQGNGNTRKPPYPSSHLRNGIIAARPQRCRAPRPQAPLRA